MQIKRLFKKTIRTIIKFCTDSPYYYESNDIKDRKLVRIFEHAQDYYYTLAISKPRELAMQLAKKDMQLFLNDMDKINTLYDGIKKEKAVCQ